MPVELSPAQRKQLKALAHSLDPVVRIGDKGLSAAVLKEIDLGLNAHQLIKVKIASDDRALRESILQQICQAMSVAPVQHIGKILILYREKIEQASAKPVAAKAPARRRASAKKAGVSRRGISAARPAGVKPALRPRRTAPGKARSAGRTR